MVNLKKLVIKRAYSKTCSTIHFIDSHLPMFLDELEIDKTKKSSKGLITILMEKMLP